MAPHWTLALLIMISVFLGIGRASIPCRALTNYQCVDDDRCIPHFDYSVYLKGCPRSQVCCAINDIMPKSFGQSCGVNGESICVPDHFCSSDVVFRHANECPNNLICCSIHLPQISLLH